MRTSSEAAQFQPGDRVVIRRGGRHVWCVLRLADDAAPWEREAAYVLRSSTGGHVRTAFESNLRGVDDVSQALER